MKNNLINIGKYTALCSKIIAIAKLKHEVGLNCYFENTANLIDLNYSKVDILNELKKDIDKLSRELFQIQGIISSIENGKVIEFNSMYNSVEDVFSSCYCNESNTISIFNVEYSLDSLIMYERIELANMICKNELGIERKELSLVLKAAELYEMKEDLVDKSILYPSIKVIDDLIALITEQDKTFNKYMKKLSYNEKVEYNKTFNRTGIHGVVKSSTYIDSTGVKQIQNVHSLSTVDKISKMLIDGLKYIEAVEVDYDGDIDKVLKLINQIESFKINTKIKFTLKIRKLGNYRALGLYLPSSNVVAEDVRNTSAILHEIAHCVHINTLYTDSFVNYMISKLVPKVNLLLHPECVSKESYYKDEREVIARALEIASLFAYEDGLLKKDDNDFDLIKSRRHYEKFSGLYFEFNNFTTKEREEFISLYKLFFESNRESINTGFDNFKLFDSNYTRYKKHKSISDLLNEENRKLNAELRATYRMVNKNTLETIYNNASCSFIELSTRILNFINLCGKDNRSSMDIDSWADTISERIYIIKYVFDAIDNFFKSDLEKVYYFNELKKHKVWDKIRSQFELEGFKFNVAKEIRSKFNEETKKELAYLRNIDNKMIKHPLLLSNDKNLLTNEDIIKEFFPENRILIAHVSKFFEYNKLKEFVLFMLEVEHQSFKIPNELKNDKEVMHVALKKKFINYKYIDKSLREDVDFAKKLIDEDVINLHNCEQVLMDNYNFSLNYMDMLELFTDRVQKLHKYQESNEISKYSSLSEKITDFKIIDFEHTKNKSINKVLKIKNKLSREVFKQIAKEFNSQKIAYYSTFAKGFIITNTDAVNNYLGINK